VVADRPSVVLTLSRKNFDRIRTEKPELAAEFLQFIVRMLADRLDSANLENAALA
jgi:sulfate permease, SulP family